MMDDTNISNSIDDNHVTMNISEDKCIKVKVVVDKEKNRVIHCQAGSDFVDAILSFLLLPMGTIINESEKQSDIGCMDTLYQSVQNLSEKFFYHEAWKSMLLKPKKELLAELKLINHPHRIEHEAGEYYVCLSCKKERVYIAVVSRTSCYYCGRSMQRYTDMKSVSSPGEFVKGMTRFVITDDLKVTMLNTDDSSQLGNDSEVTEYRTFTVDRDILLQLLNRSFLSKTPMTDVFLRNEDLMETSEQLDQVKKMIKSQTSLDHSKNLRLKLFIKKSKNKVVYALANADFVNLLFSFLTFPLGSIIKLFGGSTSIGSLDNFYESVQCLFIDNSNMEEHYLDLLLNPKLSFLWGIKNQLLQVHKEAATITPERGSIKNFRYARRFAETGSGYVKDAFTYVVTDELVVKPRCSISIVSCTSMLVDKLTEDDIFHLGVPQSDLKEEVVSVGGYEALAILQAAMTSGKVLTNVFCDRQGKRKREGRVCQLHID